MCQGESFESALAIGSAGPVVMRVFVKGNAGAFFSDREKIVASLAEDLDVPLLPTSWKVWLCRKVVDVLAELLEAAILSVYTKRRELVEATADANLRLAEAERAAATAAQSSAAAEAAAAAAAAAAETEVAEVATPFDRRVRVALVERLGERTPALLATGRAVELATAAVELALSDYFDARQMNASVEYLLDRHRLSRRLQKMPPSALELFLRKKEQIMGALLEMDADGDGDISLDEFEQGLANLRLELSPADARAIFDVLDADGGGSLQPAELETLIFGRELKEAERADMREGANREQGHSETPPVATPGKEKRSLGRTARSKRTTVAPCRATRPPHAPDAHPIARRAAPWSVWA